MKSKLRKTLRFYAVELAVGCLLPLMLSASVFGQSETGTSVGVADSSAVLLKSGGVLVGSVSFADGRYLLTSEGSEIRLAAADVAHIAKSSQELYEWQRARIKPGETARRLQLSEWCLGHELWSAAAQELMQVRSESPNHPYAEMLERRLDDAWRRSQEQPVAGKLSEQQIDSQMAEAARAAQRLRLVETLPDGAVEHFTRRVQPILVNNCTNGGCHRTGGAEAFQLNRAWIHGMADRRSTFANLAAVLAAIDQEAPESSPLLEAAGQPHAGMKQALFAGRHAELKAQLEAWVMGVAQPAEARPPGSSTRLARGPARAGPSYAGLIGGGFQQQPAAGLKRSTSTPAQAAMPATGVSSTPHDDPAVKPAGFVETYEPLDKPKVRRGAQLKPVATGDAFDPSVFNEQHR